MRKLASVKKVSEIRPIAGKDRIELAIIDGWSVIVKKNEFKVDDLCVYCEIDSVLPDREEFDFLRDKKFRIKTMKMAGVISQGICFPLSILPTPYYNEGEDVTEIIGVKQYEPTMDKEAEATEKNASDTKYPKWLMRIKLFRKLIYKSNHKEAKGFPSFISKTDETRIQNVPWILKSKEPWIATEKIDGQSGTFALVRRKSLWLWKKNKFEYIVCSRNLRLWNKNNSSYWSVSDKYKIEEKLKELIGNNEWVAIQGECVAPNVQGNKYKVAEPDLYVFNLIYPTGRAGSLTAKLICEEKGFKFVPIIGKTYILPDTVDAVLAYAHGKSQIADTIREGIVFRTQDGQKSFKAVDPLFLLKYDE